MRARLQDELIALQARLHKTIVLVTHNPQVAERARRTVRMRDGRIESEARELTGVV